MLVDVCCREKNNTFVGRELEGRWREGGGEFLI